MGSIGDGGACRACGDGDVPHCAGADTTSSAARDRCICAASCDSGRMGAECESAPDALSTTCPHAGWKLLPGTAGGGVYRCGQITSGAATGWHGHCVPAAAQCNGERNCGDGSFDGSDEMDCTSFTPTCAWPAVRRDGRCLECAAADVPARCAPGQAAPTAAANGCECSRCESSWAGPNCDVWTAPEPEPEPDSEIDLNRSQTSAALAAAVIWPATVALLVARWLLAPYQL